MLALAVALVAAQTDAEAGLKRAERALEQLDFRGAATAFERACSEARCERGQVLRAYTGLATALASSGQSAKATEAFKLLLFVSPDWSLPQAASPRLRDPFDVAQLFWRSRARPGLTLDAATGVARLEADPLKLVQRIEVRADGEPVLTSTGRSDLSDGGFSETYALPPGRFVARALTVSGSVLLESEPAVRAAPVVAAKVAPVPPAVEKPTEGRAVLHVSVAAAFDVVSRQLGAEALISASPVTMLDIGAGVVIGQAPGVRLVSSLHLPRSYRVSPFLQVRLGLHPLGTELAFGGGLAAGVSVEAGPGRLQALIAGELFKAPPDFSPWGALGFVGYELDLPFLRADR